MSLVNSQFRTVESYIQENTYWIPDYQREYSWEIKGEITDFWNDIVSLLQEDREQHFLGQIVVHDSKEDNKIYLIDGQQRTATIVIYLSVMNSLFENLYQKYNHAASKNRSEDIRLKYLGRYSEEENDLKLFLGKSDREYFQKNIQSGRPDRNEKIQSVNESHKRIHDAYFFFQDKLTEIIGNYNDVKKKYDELCKYYDCVRKNFRVVYIETDDLNEAFIIFETLNARGRDLETSDLLKNHIFRWAGSNIHVIKERWERMLVNLDGIDTTKFIRHYWNSKYSFCGEKDLYKKIRENIDNSTKCDTLSKELSDASELYAAIANPKHSDYFENRNIINSLTALCDLNASTFYPIILSLDRKKYQAKDIAKITRAIEVLVLRNIAIAGHNPNDFERLFARIATDISNERITKTEEIISEIQREIISDEDFKAAFMKASVKNVGSKARYILKCLANHGSCEIVVNDDNYDVNVEHIMPKQCKGNPDWDVSEEDHAKYQGYYGNLTLLGSEYNKKNSNKGFDVKKKIYAESKIELTRDLVKYSSWTPNDILKRQEELADMAIKVWPINIQ